MLLLGLFMKGVTSSEGACLVLNPVSHCVTSSGRVGSFLPNLHLC